MNNNELASEFVKKYPNMFNADQDFWINEIEELLNRSTEILIKEIKNRVKKI